MGIFEIATLLLAGAGLFSFVNHRYLHLPTGVGIMIIGMAVSLLLTLLAEYGVEFALPTINILSKAEFSEQIFYGFLSFLLFSGSLQFNFRDFLASKWIILTLASVGVIISTVIVGVLSFYFLKLADQEIPLAYCMVLGALISPTDPIIALAFLKNTPIPQGLRMKICGESLFNDGVAIVAFTITLGLATQHADVTGLGTALMLIREIGGGVLGGILFGWGICQLLLRTKDAHVQTLITLGGVAAGYDFARWLEFSAPIAVVISGLIVGYQARKKSSAIMKEKLFGFWEVVEELLNAFLFVMVGVNVLSITINLPLLLGGLVMVLIVLAGRWISVGLPIALFSFSHPFPKGTVNILTWLGLRGGLSLALALTIPTSPYSTLILHVTYFIVVFSILVQGLTAPRVVNYLLASSTQRT